MITTRAISPVTVLAVCLILACLSPSTRAADRSADAWISSDAADYVIGQLQNLPRFEDATVGFVVFENGRPAPTTNEFALGLRDRLQSKVTQHEGLRVHWQPGAETSSQRLPATGADCEANNRQVLIGLEAKPLGGSRMLLSLRALDVVDQSWIAGFSREWRGDLSPNQSRAQKREAADRSFLGERGVPYGPDESDLIARHLAHDLRCELMRGVSGEYAVSQKEADDEGELANVMSLVAKQITGVSSLKVVPDEDANSRLESQLHRVDRRLHQYWITLTPTGAGTGLQPVSASIYVSLPYTPSRTPDAGSIGGGQVAGRDEMIAPESGLIARLELMSSVPRSLCGSGRRAAYTTGRRTMLEDCAALEVTPRADAIVFILNHQLNRGLVRLGIGRCERRTVPRIARVDETARIALPVSLLGADWMPENIWRVQPDADTYYAIATSNSEVARALGRHIAKLPQRCSESVRSGLEGARLASWLEDFEQELSRFSSETDWRALRIRRVL